MRPGRAWADPSLGACALAVKLQGIRFGIPELAHAGDFALTSRPAQPDTLLTRWTAAASRARPGCLGVPLTIGLGIYLLIQGVGLVLSD